MIKYFKYFLQSLVVYIFFIFGRIIGLNLSRKLFALIFVKIGTHFKSKQTILKNLDTFDNELSNTDKNKITNSMWKNYGMTFIEYIFLNSMRKNNSLIKVEGEKNLELIKNRKKPVIFISGHFSNFELMSMQITKSGIKLATIYRPLNNIFLNPLMEYLRKKYVCKNQIKKGLNGVRECIEYIKKGYSIALMIDQRVSEGEKINFFNRPALTTTLPAQLALKFELPIIPVFIERTNEKNFRLKFLNEIDVRKFKDKTELTKVLNGEIEKMIRNNPYEWIWTHNRWK